jgi:sterol 3beta-glucosyltransferase
MKISILTYGSRGDLQPFLALAIALQKAGHMPTLAAPGCFTDQVGRYGIPFAALEGDPAEISRRINDAGQNPLRMVRAIKGYVLGIAAQVARQALDACRGSELIVHSFLFTTGGHTFACELGIPDISVQTFPVFAPTRAFPNAAFAGVPAGWMSYLSHWLTTQVFWYGGNSGYGRIHKSFPELPRKLRWPFRATPERPRTPMLCAWSPTVLPEPAEWSEGIHVTGYFNINTGSDYRPPIELVDFLSAGESPICISFGSMVNRNAERIYQSVFDALAVVHRRAILLCGWGGDQGVKVPERVLIMDAAPHDWLFPRCRAVIHHGGAGTTAAGLRAGIPNIVVPFAADQPFWGKCVARLKAGPEPIRVKELTAGKLVEALNEAETMNIKKNACAVGRALRGEDGLGRAITLIEQEKERFWGRRTDFKP